MFLLDTKAPRGSVPGSDGCELLARCSSVLPAPSSDEQTPGVTVGRGHQAKDYISQTPLWPHLVM